MNAREYIETGILELYLMGSLSKEEMLDVEKIAQSDAEIMQEFIRVENTLINYAYANGVEPRAELRALILAKIESEARSVSATNATASSTTATIHSIQSQSNSSAYKYLAAACLALLILSGLGNYNFWNKLKTAESEIAIMNSQKEELAQQFNTVKNGYDRTLADVSIFRNMEFITVVMKGIPAMDSTALAKVYWNKNSQEAFVDVSKLPVPAGNMQYQLWALVDGKPVDAGVFEVGNGESGLQKMKSIPNAQAFAVTLEPRGGSVSPTLSAMYVFGNV